jgi:hypothetical protein
MPVHHLLEQILDEYIVAAGLQSGQPRFEPVQRLGGYSQASPKRGFSYPRRMSHLAGDRHHDLPGERRTARARPADGGS